MTGRAFGKGFSANDGRGHVDTWVSGLLNGQFGLSLDELDEAARILKTTAAELVRSPYDHSEYLTPTEHRFMQALRALPPPIRDHFLTLAEYLIGVAPEEMEFLLEYRGLASDASDVRRARARTNNSPRSSGDSCTANRRSASHSPEAKALRRCEATIRRIDDAKGITRAMLCSREVV